MQEPIFTCPVCGTKFNTTQELNLHTQHEHPNFALEEEFRCPSCGLAFETEARLEAHIKSAHQPAPESASTPA